MNNSTDSTSTVNTEQKSGSAASSQFSDHTPPTPEQESTHPARSIPTIRSPLSPKDAVDRLARLSKHGKLPGFARTTGPGESESFRLLVFGNPYDRELRGVAAPAEAGCTISLESRLLRRMPTFVVAVMVLAIFPGVLITHSMLNVWFSWYTWSEWVTVAWYIPLCLLAVPAMLKQYRNSEKAAGVDRAKRIEQVLVATEGSF